MKAKFSEREIVEINGMQGIIFSIRENQKNKNFSYNVVIDGNYYDLTEEELISTGKFIPESKFNYYEIVKVISRKEDLKEIFNKEGVIVGKAINEDGSWGYAVSFDDGWDLEENELKSTGKFAKEEDFYTGESLRVKVSPAGEGSVSGYYDKDGKYTNSDDPEFHEIFEENDSEKG